MSHPAAIREYQEFYSDDCINILSKHLRREMNKRGADIWDLKGQWSKYLALRSESIEYLKSINEWHSNEPTAERVRQTEILDMCEI